MTLEERLSRVFGLNDKTWLNHATAGSVISRAFIPPMITFAAISRIWIGHWWLAIMVLIAVWTFINVRVFPKTKSYDNWYGRCAFGERVYSARKKTPIPNHHATAAKALKVLNLLFTIIWIYGLVALNIELAVTGFLLQLSAKFWFLDRMVWLFNDMENDPAHAHLKKIIVNGPD